MNGSERGSGVRRILIALDASPHSLSALCAAAELAARLRADLLGLFVEDINLVRMAQLPFTREVGFFSGTLHRLDSRHVERQLHTQAVRARRALASAADRTQVRWSFRTARGEIAAQVLAAAAETDLVILGKASWVGQTGLGSTARAVLARASGPVLVLRHGVRLGLPALVLYDGSAEATRALASAAQMTGEEGHLVLLLVADTSEAAGCLQSRAAEWLRARGTQAHYRRLSRADVPRLCRVVQEEGGGMLVLSVDSPSFRAEALAALLQVVECPVLSIR